MYSRCLCVLGSYRRAASSMLVPIRDRHELASGDSITRYPTRPYVRILCYATDIVESVRVRGV